MLSAVVEVPALADDDTEDISVAAEGSSPVVASELQLFMEHLLKLQTKVGIAAFAKLIIELFDNPIFLLELCPHI